MKESTTETVKFIASLICLIGGIVLSFIALFLPPSGEIHSSVLILIGEVLTFIGAVWHLKDYASIQIRKIDEQIEKMRCDKKDDSMV